MEIAILVASVIAAVGALVATIDIVRRILRERPELDIRFTGGWRADEKRIEFIVRATNNGATTINQIDLWGFIQGQALGSEGNLGRIALRPDAFHEAAVDIARPKMIDLRPNEVLPTLKARVGVLARYGKHHRTIWLADSGLVVVGYSLEDDPNGR